MSTFLEGLNKLVQTVSTVLEGPVIPAAVEIGREVLQLIDKTKTVVDTNDIPALEAMRDKLEPLVLAHADATEAALRGSE